MPRQSPVLLLDRFKVHNCAGVLAAIRDLGVRVPVDVGIGKPLKSRLRNAWYDFMIEQGLEGAGMCARLRVGKGSHAGSPIVCMDWMKKNVDQILKSEKGIPKDPPFSR